MPGNRVDHACRDRRRGEQTRPHRGADVLADGEVTPAIIGVALDGTNGNMKILDTDDGELDGDKTYDRAVGPFQFIPETWQRYDVGDANGDGVADPNNIDDAALSAARYLCVSSGGDMTTAEGWESAVMVYNRSMSYRAQGPRLRQRLFGERPPLISRRPAGPPRPSPKRHQTV